MGNDSGDRSIQVQDGENNDSRELSFVSQERHKNEGKDSLANRKQESQSTVTKRKKSRKQKVSSSGEVFNWLKKLSTDSSSQANKKKKAKRRRHHLPQLPAMQVSMKNHVMAGLALSQKMKNLNGNYPKAWPTTQTNILRSTFQKIVWKRPYYKTSSQIILIMSSLRDILKRKTQNKQTKYRKCSGEASGKNCWCDGSSVEVLEYSRGSKRGRRICCPNIYKGFTPLRWTDCAATGTKQ